MEDLFGSKEYIPELVTRRLEAVVQQDPSFKVGSEEGRGDTSIVYNCTTAMESLPSVLKVSYMERGLPEIELSTYGRLHGVKGIPRVFQTYYDRKVIIALLLEKIQGVSLHEHLGTQENIGGTLIAFHDLIDAFHGRGLKMPKDWLKDNNWRVTSAGIPYLIDLGESQSFGSRYEEDIKAEVRTDLRSFHALIEKYSSRLNKSERKILEKVTYRDHLNNRSNGYGGNPYDR